MDGQRLLVVQTESQKCVFTRRNEGACGVELIQNFCKSAPGLPGVIDPKLQHHIVVVDGTVADAIRLHLDPVVRSIIHETLPHSIQRNGQGIQVLLPQVSDISD